MATDRDDRLEKLDRIITGDRDSEDKKRRDGLQRRVEDIETKEDEWEPDMKVLRAAREVGLFTLRYVGPVVALSGIAAAVVRFLTGGAP